LILSIHTAENAVTMIMTTTEVANVSHRAGGQHKYHAVQQWKNTINLSYSVEHYG